MVKDRAENWPDWYLESEAESFLALMKADRFSNEDIAKTIKKLTEYAREDGVDI